MTLEEAWKTDRQLILTLDPPDGSPSYTDVMIRPYCMFADGSIYGEMRSGGDAHIFPEFILKVELGEPIV